MWAKYVAVRRFVGGRRRFRTPYGSQRQGSSIHRITPFYSVDCIIASKQSGTGAQTIYKETFYNRLCSCFSTGPVKEVPRTDPRQISLDLIPSLPSLPNCLFTSMLKVMTTLISFACKKHLGFGNTARVWGQRGIQASLVLRDFFLRDIPLTRLESLHDFFEFVR